MNVYPWKCCFCGSEKNLWCWTGVEPPDDQPFCQSCKIEQYNFPNRYPTRKKGEAIVGLGPLEEQPHE